MNDVNNLSKEELIEYVNELEMLNRQLLEEKQQEDRLEYAWSGNLGHWYWNIKTNNVTFNPLKIKTLGYDESDVPNKVDYQYFTDLLHPDDYPKAMDAMRDHLYGKKPVYEVEYRIKTKDGGYLWYYDRGKITQYDDQGKPVFMAGIVFDITEKKRIESNLVDENKILSELSSIDGLTQVNNHRSLLNFLKEETINSMKNNQQLTIGIFDIDDFKKVNDTKGHVFGDKVLFDVASIMKKAVRDKDLVGRYGGEEFMIVLPHTNIEQAKIVAERIRSSIEKKMFEDMHITISGGLKQYNNEDLAEFVHQADLNLYQAKGTGKNKVIS